MIYYARRCGIILGMIVLLATISMHVSAATSFEMLVPPQLKHARESVQLFHDQDGNVNLAYVKQEVGKPGGLFHLVQKGNVWSSPMSVSLPNGNFVRLHSVETLSNGTPLMLLSWDKVDYLKLFNITIDPNNPPPPNTPFPISHDELLRLMDQNQQLFYRLYVNSQWTDMMPIPGTFKAKKTVLRSGPDNSAVVIFGRDHNADASILSDDEIYAMTFHDNHWSTPVRLTTNGQMEANVQTAWVNDRYLIVWSVDQDNDLATKQDKQLFFASAGKDGTLLNTAAPITQPFEQEGFPYPILGVHGNVGMLLWQSIEQTSEGEAAEIVWEQKFSGSWSQPDDTNISLSAVHDATVYETDGGCLAVLNDGQRIWPLYYNGVEWTGGKEIVDMKKGGITHQDIEYLYRSGTIDIGLIARAVSGQNADPNLPSGIYHASSPVLPDLAIAAIQDEPYIKRVGKTVTIAMEVVNEGGLPSQDYSVEISSNDQLLESLQGTSLLPGKSELLSAELQLTKPYLPLDIRLVNASLEMSIQNNQETYVIRVLPDYRVQDVRMTEAGGFLALIEEQKGIAAPPVSVEAFLIAGGVRILVAQKTYDPRRDNEVAIDGVVLPANEESYQIEVKVNAQRTIKEDRYDNNSGSYIFDPKPDFVISAISADNDQVQIIVESQGKTATEQIPLIVTDDPRVATQDAPQAPLPHTETISFQSGNQQTVSIDLSELSLAGDYLYAVVNPYGTAEESDYNNNLMRFSRQTTVAKQHELILDNPEGICGKIGVTVANTGAAPAVYSYVELYDEQMNVIARKTASGIDPESFQRITFTNTNPGSYLLRLIDPARKSKVASEVSLEHASRSSDDGCAQIPSPPVPHSADESPYPKEPRLVEGPLEGSSPPSPRLMLSSSCSLVAGVAAADSTIIMLVAGILVPLLAFAIRRRYA